MSIGRKFILAVVSIVLIAMSASVSIFTSIEYRAEKKKLETFSGMTGRFIQESLVSSMVQRHTSGLDQKLADIKKTSDVIGNIWLLNAEGIVKNSTDPASIGGRMNASAVTGDRKDHSRQDSFLKGKKTYRLIHSFRNDPACWKCHGRQAQYNGTLVIDFSLNEIMEHMQKEIYASGAVMFVVLILTGAAILVLWNLLVGKRLSSVIDRVRLLKDGTYHSGRDPHGKDEFARLEQGFNHMAAAIQARDREKENLVQQLSATNQDLLEEVGKRKQWELLLREQKKFSDNLIHNSAVATFVLDKNHRVVIWNRACEELTGVTATDIVGTNSQWKAFYLCPRQTLADLVLEGKTDLSGLYEKYAPSTLIADGLHAEGWYEKLNGRDRYIIFDAAPIPDSSGELAAVIETLQDVTIQKRAEEAVLQTNHALQTLVNASPIPIMVLDLDGNVTVWNPAAELLFGWTAEEAVGNINPIVPEHKKEEFMAFQNRVMRGEAFTALELQRQRKDGSSVDVSLSTAPLRNGQGRIIGSMALLTDITGRKRADEVIRRNYDTQTAINWILHISLENMPLENILKQALDLILSITWLSFQSRGAIFLVEDHPDKLVMKAERGLSSQIMKECAVVPFGKCLCGIAAAKGEVEFSRTLDDRHEIRYEGVTGHGHYCVPIKQGRTIFGVINIYIREGHARDHKEIEFLNAIANALAGVIRRSRAEAALQESEKRYRTLAEAAHDVIFILNREGQIEYVNSFGANLFGITPQEQIGKNIAEFFPLDITERQRANVSKVFDTGESLYVENAFAFSGAESWLGTWLVPLKDGDAVTAVLGVSRDISEKRRSDQEREKLIQELQTAFNTISRSHKEWQNTFDSIMDMIAIIDKDFTILKANKAFASCFGLHPKQVINKKCYEFHHETSSPIPGCPHHRTIVEKNASSEEIFDKKTNRVFRMTTFPYFSPDGEIIGSIHISRDITEEKEREMRLIMSERLAALGQMASGIAHEINNPLASIAGCSEGLLSRIRKGKCDYKLFETYLNIIQEEIFRCKSITTGMLSFVRKTTYEKKEVNINDMLDRTLEIISFQGRLKDVKIEKKYAVSLRVRANEGELRQVFLAVITNALDAMEDKGSLLVESGANGNTLYARIIDSGRGISAENIAKIFDPFYTTKSETGGTGLGLSIARKIMHNHNGTIEAASNPGKGSVFTITLPVS